MENDTKKCAHDQCSCAVRDGSEYCSSQCESAGSGDMTSISCDCGHPGCGQGM